MPTSALMQLMEAGKVRLLAVTAAQRVAGELKNVPTWKEQEVDTTHEVWRGLVGPKGMSPAQVAFWDDVLGKAVKTDEWRKDLEQGKIENVYRASGDAAKYWRERNEEVRAILTDLGLAK
jgi:putative tricarboxylic transport membrane protein